MPSMAIPNELRVFLRARREELGVNQDEFSNPKVSRTTVQNVENGTVSHIRKRTLVRMAVNLDITPEELTANGFKEVADALTYALRREDTYTATYRRTMRRRAEGEQDLGRGPAVMEVLNVTWLHLSQVATCIMLGSMLVFTALYVGRGNWWHDPLGWSIAIERVAFVFLLALLVANDYWDFSTAVEDDLLLAEVVLLLVASVGVNGGTVMMFRYQQADRKPRTLARHHGD